MTELLKDELEFTIQNIEENTSRKTFDLNQMTTVEADINRSEKLTDILNKRARTLEAKLMADQYLEYVFNEIESHAEGSGVTIFMPHVITRDLYKKVLEVADTLRLTPREKRAVTVAPEHLKIINYSQVNMPEVLFEHIKSKEVFMICWRKPESESQPVECNRFTS